MAQATVPTQEGTAATGRSGHVLAPEPQLIGELLIAREAVSSASVENALEVQAEKGGRLGEILLDMEAVREEDVARALAEQLGLEYADGLDADAIDPKLVSRMSLGYVRENGILPLSLDENGLRLAVSDPLHTFAVDDMRVLFQTDIEMVVAPRSRIEAAMHRVFDRRAAAEQVVDDLEEDQDVGSLANDLEEQTKDLLDEDDEAPIIRLVNSLLNQAIKEGASDVHIEPYEKAVVVRFRKDGVLKEVVRAPKRFQASIASRIKIMGNLNIAEKRLPQDGRIRIKIAGRDVDLRLSTIPTTIGERIVMRILDKASVILDLESLGFRPDNLEVINDLIERPHGIILVTGPTGSGKTTTLYAGLNRINTPDKNILTVEDPVEYQLEGIGQMQVNRKIDFTFARGLRAILRQDPDVVLIGEIRDLETAENAIQAALTGHLVFATLHTNDAPSAFTRLTDMGVEPFLTASSVNAVMAQRLVRCVCKHCKEPHEPLPDELAQLGLEDPERIAAEHTVFRAVGCEECLHTGYKGRMGIHELLVVDDPIRSSVMQNVSSSDLKHRAIERGMSTLRVDGAKKVLAGTTTIDEVMRVTAEDTS